MSNSKNVSLLTVTLFLIINLSTNPVNSEMRKSWSRKTSLNETDKSEPMSTQEIINYFQENAKNSDFESVFSDQTQANEEITTTKTNDETMESEITTEVAYDESKSKVTNKSDDDDNDEDSEIVSDDSETENIETEKIDEKNSNENITESQRDLIRRGLNLIVLGK